MIETAMRGYWTYLNEFFSYLTQTTEELCIGKRDEYILKLFLLNILEQFNTKQKMNFNNTHQGAEKRSVEIAFFCQKMIKSNSARLKKRS